MRHIVLILWLTGLVLAAAAEPAKLTGRVTHVTDGDTLTLRTPDGQQLEIRLAEIDTPEHGRPWFAEARDALSGLVADKDVTVVVQDTDRFERIVGRVYVGRLDVCAELVEKGHAWVLRKYAEDLRLYDLETQARSARRGLWALPQAREAPPWEWRIGSIGRASTATPEPADPDCHIKGNITRNGERIYHLPGGRSYEQTKIDPTRGERWFCSEREALDAGWRGPRQ